MAVVEQLVGGDFRTGKKVMVFCNTMPSCQVGRGTSCIQLTHSLKSAW
jgi:hypothetical protein